MPRRNETPLIGGRATDNTQPLGDPSFVDDAEYENIQSEPENPHYEPQAPTTNTLLVDDDLSLMTDGMLQAVDPSRSDEIWNVVDEFFDTMYVVFPVLSYAGLASRLIIEPAWNTVPDFRTLLLSVKLVNAAGQYRMAPETGVSLSDLIKQVEASRLDYEFADPPTLDAVVISLFLFTAYNVLEKHNRAFLYLDEALSLVEAVEAVDDEEERHRKLQIEQVLFNTEAATMAIYADKNRRPRARKPARVTEGATGLGIGPQISAGGGIGGMMMMTTTNTIAESDRVAMHLLRRLTEIHLAENAEALEVVDIEFEADMATLFWAVFNRHRYSRIQAADVVVTRQWQLSSKLVASLKQGRGISKRFQESIELLGLTAMSWICLLGEGELRIVGLGKLSGLAQNIHALAGRGRCQYILGGLAGAVIKEDHEKIFAPQLADVVMPMMVASVPAPMRPMRDYEFWAPPASSHPTTTTAAGAIEAAGNATDLEGWESATTTTTTQNRAIAGAASGNDRYAAGDSVD